MATVNIYLTFDGNCREAFEFYHSVLGGTAPQFSTFGDMPRQEGQPEMSDEAKAKVMHVILFISKETALMGSDTGEGDWAPNYKQGNNFSISLNVETREKADRVFAGLSAGGKVTMPLAEMFWGDYFGMLTDKFGVNWMVNQSNK